MSEVTRFTVSGTEFEMWESTIGEFVDYEDYAALQQQVEKLLAENVALKSGISDITFMDDESFFGSTNKAQQVMGGLVNIKTPATDAALNAVRADAKREFCQNLDRYGKVEPYHFDPDFAYFYATIRKKVYDEILDNPAVHDMSSMVDWLEQRASDSRAYADMSIEHAHQLRTQSGDSIDHVEVGK